MRVRERTQLWCTTVIIRLYEIPNNNGGIGDGNKRKFFFFKYLFPYYTRFEVVMQNMMLAKISYFTFFFLFDGATITLNYIRFHHFFQALLSSLLITFLTSKYILSLRIMLTFCPKRSPDITLL